MRSVATVAALLSTSLLVLESGRAEDAEAIYQQALGRFTRAEFRNSATLLERARGLASDHKLLGRIELQLGVCREIMGELEAARAAFRAALEHDSTLELEPARTRATAIALFRSVRQSLRGEINVACDGGPGNAWLDQAALGRLPLRRPISIGAHQVKIVGFDGAVVWHGAVVVPSGKTVEVRTHCPHPPSRLSISSEPPQAEVMLDGAAVVGRTPLRDLTVRPGRHRLVLRCQGHREQSVVFDIAPGARRELAVRLSLLQPPPPPVPPLPRRRLWTWMAGGAAVASLAAALGTGLGSRSDRSDWETEWAVGIDGERWNALRTSGQQKELATNVLIGVGAALATTAAILYFLEGRPRREAGRLNASPSPGALTATPACQPARLGPPASRPPARLQTRDAGLGGSL